MTDKPMTGIQRARLELLEPLRALGFVKRGGHFEMSVTANRKVTVNLMHAVQGYAKGYALVSPMMGVGFADVSTVMTSLTGFPHGYGATLSRQVGELIDPPRTGDWLVGPEFDESWDLPIKVERELSMITAIETWGLPWAYGLDTLEAVAALPVLERGTMFDPTYAVVLALTGQAHRAMQTLNDHLERVRKTSPSGLPGVQRFIDRFTQWVDAGLPPEGLPSPAT